jgi:hypothetical protein
MKTYTVTYTLTDGGLDRTLEPIEAACIADALFIMSNKFALLRIHNVHTCKIEF